jgi:hypothetical protein
VAAITHDAKLNELLIDLGRSLLQYASESSLWARDPRVASRFESLAARQRGQVARLVELLLERGWSVDFGSYPTEYTDLHFVSLEYLYPQILAEQSVLVTELDEAIHTCADDPIAVDLLRGLHADELQLLDELRNLDPVRPESTAA